jgi:hypothetical protein
MVVKEVVNWSSGYAVIGLSISAFAEVKVALCSVVRSNFGSVSSLITVFS